MPSRSTRHDPVGAAARRAQSSEGAAHGPRGDHGAVRRAEVIVVMSTMVSVMWAAFVLVNLIVVAVQADSANGEERRC